MEHDTEFLPNEHVLLSGKVFISWLGPADLSALELGWHYSVDGEIFLLTKSSDEYAFVKHMSDRPTRLRNTNEIEDYIREAVKLATGSSDMLRSMLKATDAVCLALYPGFMKEVDGLGKSNSMLQLLYDSAESQNPGATGKLLAYCITLIGTSSKQAMSFVHHCLRHLPPYFVGLLCAHGLTSRSFWKAKHREALIEAWRYQLLNPSQRYDIQLTDANTASSMALIERDIAPEDRRALLAATGLNERDIILATEIANLAPANEPSLRTRTFLNFLGQRSNQRLPQKDTVNIESLGALADST